VRDNGRLHAVLLSICNPLVTMVAISPIKRIAAGLDTKTPAPPLMLSIMLPCFFAALFVCLLVISWRLTRKLDEDSSLEKPKTALQKLSAVAPSQIWVDRANKGSDVESYDEPVCAICLEVIGTETRIRRLPCVHVFHKDCLDEWVGRVHMRCPVCRKPFLGRQESC